MGQFFFSTRDVANIDIIDPHEQSCHPAYARLYYNRQHPFVCTSQVFIFLRHNLVNRLDLFVAHGAPC